VCVCVCAKGVCVCVCVCACVSVCRDKGVFVSAETEWATDTQPGERQSGQQTPSPSLVFAYTVSNNLHYTRTHVCRGQIHTHTHTQMQTCRLWWTCRSSCSCVTRPRQCTSKAHFWPVRNCLTRKSPVSLNSSHRCINVSSLTFTAAQDEFLLHARDSMLKTAFTTTGEAAERVLRDHSFSSRNSSKANTIVSRIRTITLKQKSIKFGCISCISLEVGDTIEAAFRRKLDKHSA